MPQPSHPAYQFEDVHLAPPSGETAAIITRINASRALDEATFDALSEHDDPRVFQALCRHLSRRLLPREHNHVRAVHLLDTALRRADAVGFIWTARLEYCADMIYVGDRVLAYDSPSRLRLTERQERMIPWIRQAPDWATLAPLWKRAGWWRAMLLEHAAVPPGVVRRAVLPEGAIQVALGAPKDSLAALFLVGDDPENFDSWCPRRDSALPAATRAALVTRLLKEYDDADVLWPMIERGYRCTTRQWSAIIKSVRSDLGAHTSPRTSHLHLILRPEAPVSATLAYRAMRSFLLEGAPSETSLFYIPLLLQMAQHPAADDQIWTQISRWAYLPYKGTMLLKYLVAPGALGASVIARCVIATLFRRNQAGLPYLAEFLSSEVFWTAVMILLSQDRFDIVAQALAAAPGTIWADIHPDVANALMQSPSANVRVAFVLGSGSAPEAAQVISLHGGLGRGRGPGRDPLLRALRRNRSLSASR